MNIPHVLLYLAMLCWNLEANADHHVISKEIEKSRWTLSVCIAHAEL